MVTATPNTVQLPRLLCSLGMIPLSSSREKGTEHLHVILDGRVLGYIPVTEATELAQKLRVLKARGEEGVPPTLEVGLVPLIPKGQYQGLFLFSTPARMMRPVTNLMTVTTELIGSFEQVYMNIAVCLDEVKKKVGVVWVT